VDNVYFTQPNTDAGHSIFKKCFLEIVFRFTRYLVNLGVLEDKGRAFLLYAPDLVFFSMAGRMMQVRDEIIHQPPATLNIPPTAATNPSVDLACPINSPRQRTLMHPSSRHRTTSF